MSGEATNRNCEAGQGLQRFLLRALHQHGLVPTALHLPRRTQRQKGAQTFTCLNHFSDVLETYQKNLINYPSPPLPPSACSAVGSMNQSHLNNSEGFKMHSSPCCPHPACQTASNTHQGLCLLRLLELRQLFPSLHDGNLPKTARKKRDKESIGDTNTSGMK